MFSPSKWPILTEKLKKLAVGNLGACAKKGVGISGALNVGILGASSVGQIGAPRKVVFSIPHQLLLC